ncbi:uncharacterized protein AAG666_009806 isoform 1-T2 [Megaptera novaeangliae]
MEEKPTQTVAYKAVCLSTESQNRNSDFFSYTQFFLQRVNMKNVTLLKLIWKKLCILGRRLFSALNDGFQRNLNAAHSRSVNPVFFQLIATPSFTGHYKDVNG